MQSLQTEACYVAGQKKWFPLALAPPKELRLLKLTAIALADIAQQS